MKPRIAIFLLLAGSALAACGPQSALTPNGPKAENIAWLFWVFVAVCGVVSLIVFALLAIPLVRRRETAPDPKRTGTLVGAGVATTVVILIGFTIASYVATRSSAMTTEGALTIKITAWQWWWSIEYQDPQPSRAFAVNNEFHIPVGTPVHIKLAAGDVIHSFWIPNIAGKQDLIPGRENTISISATRPGTYRGQCAEFCGLQHSNMALLLVAETRDKFAAWREAQLKPAPVPAEPDRAAGLAAVMAQPGLMCHTIHGTDAGGRSGPDLTHFGSQQTIAAGALRNTPDNLAAWISDPQTIKPGCNMPKVDLTGEETVQIAAYLEGLK